MAEAYLDTSAPAAGIAAVRDVVQTNDTLIGNAQTRKLAQQAQTFGQYAQLRTLAQTDRQQNQNETALSLDQQRFNLEKRKFVSARNDIKRVLSSFGGVVVGDQQAAELAAKLKALDFVKSQGLAQQEQASVLRQELMRASELPNATERLSSLRAAIAANPLGFNSLNSSEQEQFLSVSKQSQAVATQDAFSDVMAADTVEAYKEAARKHSAAIASNPSLATLFQNKYAVLAATARTTETNKTREDIAKLREARERAAGLSPATLERDYLDKTGVSDSGSPIWYYRLPGLGGKKVMAFDGSNYYDRDGNICSIVELRQELREQAAQDATFQNRQADASIVAPTGDLTSYGDTRLQTAATLDNTYLKAVSTLFSTTSQ